LKSYIARSEQIGLDRTVSKLLPVSDDPTPAGQSPWRLRERYY